MIFQVKNPFFFDVFPLRTSWNKSSLTKDKNEFEGLDKPTLTAFLELSDSQDFDAKSKMKDFWKI